MEWAMRKMLEWALRKKETPEYLLRSVMRLHGEAKTMIIVNSELSEDSEVKVGMHQKSVLSPFLFALVVDVVTELAREGALSELLNADDLVMMSETIKGLRDKFIKCKESSESKILKDYLGKTKVILQSLDDQQHHHKR